MTKIEDLIIGELYQYKDKNFEIWGFYNGKNINFFHEFKTLLSVNNCWTNEIFQISERKEGYLQNITKLS
jgi:hypothetical protein